MDLALDSRAKCRRASQTSRVSRSWELLACVSKICLWANKLLKGLGLDQQTPVLHIDNQSTIKVCSEAGNFDGVKRLAKKSRKIAEHVEAKKLKVKYVPTSDNIADMFTKALGPQQFEKLRRLLKVEDMVAAVELHVVSEIEHVESSMDSRPDAMNNDKEACFPGEYEPFGCSSRKLTFLSRPISIDWD
ncbi:hypothetical protein PF005_g14078 [Phytophthora fragariae]|uniref:Reverse transcriptase Ty1/copia-type domain-containing protein n=1 Tax=Phytophthora fragariae TaxID=53985 RepID=A0A6A3ZWD8_9STRA|nr:hypothetical protein PF003_g6421 [Phytophthora fragariae]KAE8934394.1 hypothetical protein PF009_g15634 [Phytophthora fragariae]KAE9111626.1 hypothetical protein PF007_g11417 [Phytophthora fragariae]KAE9143864.1 hypothetical protein PF006_g11139 [Phytophthora fragariae]KAE9203692.1 hypothetical protein PF005_g14078 [Phytophthora fragariae]